MAGSKPRPRLNIYTSRRGIRAQGLERHMLIKVTGIDIGGGAVPLYTHAGGRELFDSLFRK